MNWTIWGTGAYKVMLDEHKYLIGCLSSLAYYAPYALPTETTLTMVTNYLVFFFLQHSISITRLFSLFFILLCTLPIPPSHQRLQYMYIIIDVMFSFWCFVRIPHGVMAWAWWVFMELFKECLHLHYIFAFEYQKYNCHMITNSS